MMAKEITVNGTPRRNAPERLPGLLEAEGLDTQRRGLAVAINGQVVPRQAWGEIVLHDGDTVEIVKPFSGG